MPLAGGLAHRLTANLSEVSYPRCLRTGHGQPGRDPQLDRAARLAVSLLARHKPLAADVLNRPPCPTRAAPSVGSASSTARRSLLSVPLWA